MQDRPRTTETFIIAALLLAMLAHVLDFVIMMPLGPMLMREFTISAAEFGEIVSVYTFAAAASSLLSTTWVDRLDRKLALLLLLVGFLAGNLLCVWAPTVSILVIGRLAAGIFGGVMTAIVYSIIGQVISTDRRGSASGIMGTAFPLVSILGVPLALKITEYFGWRASFFLVLAVSLIAIILVIIALPRLRPDASEQRPSLLGPAKQALSYRPHIYGMALVILIVFGGFTIVPYIAPFLINNGYIVENELYLIYLVGGSFSIISSRVVGGLADRFGKIKTLRWMLVFTIMAMALFTNLPEYSLYLVLFSSTTLMIFVPGRYVCVMAYLTIICDAKNRGAYMSFVATVQQLTIGLAAIVGGYLVGEGADGSLNTFWLAGIFAISCNVLVLLFSPKLQKLEKSA